MKRRIKKLLATTAMLIFNLIVCFSSAFAWFTAATHNDTEGMNFVIDANELILTYEIYKYDSDLEAVKKIENFEFTDYDPWINKHNENIELVLKADLSSSLFKVGELITIDILWHCNVDNPRSYVYSNVLYFKSKAINIDETDIYFNAKAALEEEDKHTFFTTTKLTDISYSITTTPVEDRNITIYSVISYDRECFLNLLDINHLGTNQDFEDDISPIRIGIQA